MGTIFNKSSGYRKLYSFNFATIVHLGTITFVRRFVDWKHDPLGKLAELLGGLEDFLACRGSIPWSIHTKDYQAVNGITLEPFAYSDDVLHDYWTHLHREKKSDFWGCSGYPDCWGTLDIPQPS